MIEKPYLKLSNGEILNIGDVKKTMQGELTIQNFSYGFDLASRTSIINHLIHKHKFKNYLEIGVRDGRNYDKIIAKNKIGVDPDPTKKITGLYKLTSDKFFKINKMKFDLIFIDGLHLEYQVDKDIEESLKVLSDDGFIVMHDCNPPTKFHQRENYEIDGKFPPWNGTVWKSYAKLRIKSFDLSLSCVDCDWGIGLIRKKKQSNFKLSENLDFNFLDKNRVSLLNLISVNNFIKNY
jgi:hypothetical protein